MRALLADLCDELTARYHEEATVLRLPVRYFRYLRGRLSLHDYGGWKTVGWIEELNDLVYFVDLSVQVRKDRSPAEFAEALLADCEGRFYENTYLEELFPRGRPDPAGLAMRLRALCTRLARQVTQESLLLVPGLPCVWLAETGMGRWSVPAELAPNFERAEFPGCLAIGLEGAYLAPPTILRQRLERVGWQAMLEVRPGGMWLRVGRRAFPLLTRRGAERRWLWHEVRPRMVSSGRADGQAGQGGIVLGPTVVYGRDRTPRSVTHSPRELAERLHTALEAIRQAWPTGAGLLALLTARVVPLRAKGVVSFSYRHRPGLSFINLFDRNRLDLIDDLIHENSHHHLNVLLRKYRLLDEERTEEIFYSPWRRSLRPLRGILHATFTFTMGAILFERLSSFEARGAGHEARDEKRVRLTPDEVLRARFRCLEELESVRYSLQDLDYAATELGWLRAAGRSLVDSLRLEIELVRKRMAPYGASVLRSRYGPALRRHTRTLEEARAIYGRALARTVR